MERRKLLYSRLLDLMPAFLIAVGADGNILYMNRTMLRALGYELSEVRGKPYLSLIVPEIERNHVRTEWGNKATINAHHTLGKCGQAFFIEWHGLPIYENNTQFQYSLGVGIDMTERKKLEEELFENKQKLDMMFNQMQSVFDSTEDLIWAVDRNYKLIFF